MDLGKVRDAIVRAFATPAALDAWVTQHVPGENINNILTPGTFDARAYQLLQWAESRGRLGEVLQALADYPPPGGGALPSAVFVATNGAITPSTAVRSGIPPIAPIKDWFVTKRPFADRRDLRTALEDFDRAQDGADSVLLVEGGTFSGKSYGLRLAKRLAPNDNFVELDPKEWDTVAMTVADVAAILTGTTDQPPRVDLTKEDQAAPRLLETVKEKLKGSGKWIIVDHFNRANLTQAAATLLVRLAEAIEGGSLSGVRLILADADRSKLSRPLQTLSRRDRAELPNRTAVREWCETLAAHMGKTGTPAAFDQMVDDVFADPPPGETLVDLIEERLSKQYERIARL